MLLLIHVINDRRGHKRFQTRPRAITPVIDINTLQTKDAENVQDFCKELHTLSYCYANQEHQPRSRRAIFIFSFLTDDAVFLKWQHTVKAPFRISLYCLQQSNKVILQKNVANQLTFCSEYKSAMFGANPIQHITECHSIFSCSGGCIVLWVCL
jgi:hypothetical protein